ncbi:MAG: DUF4397 domain-containing protein [Planctomycetes bacterium]|nr:DUF4397 domain-containing protein [Planctomycetota bacterium]
MLSVLFALPATLEAGTRLRVAHLSPDAPAVDIWVDGAVALSGVEFGAVSGYLSLAAGTYRVQVTPAGADSPVVIDADITLENGRSYTVAATGSLAAGDLQPAIYADERTVTSESSSVRFIHASPDAPPVDIAAAGGPVLFAGVEFRQGTEYLALDAGTYDLEVRLAGTETVALSVPSVILSPGANSTIFAIGLAGDGSLAALPVIDVDGFFLRGDANRDGELDISDPVAVLFHLFLTQPARFCSDAADVDDDGHLMLSDAIYSLNHLFAGGRQPAPPFPAPGIDATADLLGCEDRMRF